MLRCSASTAAGRTRPPAPPAPSRTAAPATHAIPGCRFPTRRCLGAHPQPPAPAGHRVARAANTQHARAQDGGAVEAGTLACARQPPQHPLSPRGGAARRSLRRPSSRASQQPWRLARRCWAPSSSRAGGAGGAGALGGGGRRGQPPLPRSRGAPLTPDRLPPPQGLHLCAHMDGRQRRRHPVSAGGGDVGGGGAAGGEACAAACRACLWRRAHPPPSHLAPRPLPLPPHPPSFNKWLLAYSGFPFPITLTMWHMAFCSTVGFICIRVLGVVKSHNMPAKEYFSRVMPIGARAGGSAGLLRAGGPPWGEPPLRCPPDTPSRASTHACAPRRAIRRQPVALKLGLPLPLGLLHPDDKVAHAGAGVRVGCAGGGRW